MARARTIKPGFFKNEDLCALPFAARLLFAGLWTIADRDGRLEDRPKRIKAEVFPYDDLDCEDLLCILQSADFIQRYESVDGLRYISIPSWKKHQNPHKNETVSIIPSITLSIGDADTSNVRSAPACLLSSSSQITCLQNLPSERSPVGEGEFELESPHTEPSLVELQDQWFTGEFWPAYWRKVDKAAALASFRKHARTEQIKQRIVDAVIAHAPQYLRRDPEHRPHAATWLNKRRYEEPPEDTSFTPPPSRPHSVMDLV